MTHCAKCSAELIGSRRFCAACGAPVTEAPTATAKESAPKEAVSPFAVTAAPHMMEAAAASPTPSTAADPALPFARTADSARPSVLPASQLSPLAKSNLVPESSELQAALASHAAKSSGTPAKIPSTRAMAATPDPVVSSSREPSKPQVRTQLLGAFPPPNSAIAQPLSNPQARSNAPPALARPAAAPPPASFQQRPPHPTPQGFAQPQPLAPGARVTVAWSDGRRYPGTLLQVTAHQGLVVFPDGQQHWVGLPFIVAG